MREVPNGNAHYSRVHQMLPPSTSGIHLRRRITRTATVSAEGDQLTELTSERADGPERSEPFQTDHYYSINSTRNSTRFLYNISIIV